MSWALGGQLLLGRSLTGAPWHLYLLNPRRPWLYRELAV